MVSTPTGANDSDQLTTHNSLLTIPLSPQGVNGAIRAGRGRWDLTTHNLDQVSLEKHLESSPLVGLAADIDASAQRFYLRLNEVEPESLTFHM